jgi:hypothetical protein
MKVRYLFLGLTISLGLGFFVVQPQQVAAISGSEFNAANIIDDAAFFNSTTMNTGDIQNFLNVKIACDTNGTRPSGRSGYPTRADWGRANNAPPPYTCLKDYSQSFDSVAANAYCGAISGGNKSAANIIFDVARACGINPQVLVVLLQKEQGLVTDEWPWPGQYQKATGYACPDTAPCDSQYYGFFNQVYNAAKQSQRYVKQPQSFNYASGRTSFIQYNPSSSCGGSNVGIRNSATAALYNYTPYQPNAGALSLVTDSSPGGTVNCGAYGNRNFWWYFNKWFGPTSGDGFSLVKDSTCASACQQWVVYGTIKQRVPDSQTVYAWGLQNVPLSDMEPSILNAYTTASTNLDRLMYGRGGSVLYMVDNGKRYSVHSATALDAWNLRSTPISTVSPGLFNMTTEGGPLTYSLKNPSNNTMYAVEGTVIRPYQNDTVYAAWEGENTPYISVSSDMFSRFSVGATLTSTKVAYGGSEYQVAGGYRMAQPAAYASLFPGSAQTIASQTFNRLPQTANVLYLVKSKSSPNIYLLDNGQKHHIESPDLLTAWSTPTAGYHTFDAAYVDLIPTGSSIGSYRADVAGQLYVIDRYKYAIPSALDAAYRNSGSVYSASASLMALFGSSTEETTGFIKGRNSSQVYLLDNSGNKRYIDSQSRLSIWRGSQDITVFDDFIINAIGSGSNLQSFVSDGSTEYVMEDSKKVSVSSGAKAEWGLNGAQIFSDGTLNRFTANGSLPTALKDNGAYFLIRDGAAYATADTNIADIWGIDTAATRNSGMVASQLPVYMLTRLVKSSTDSRIFLVDNGNWHSLDVGPRNNIDPRYNSSMSLDPANAPNTITPWTSFIVKNAQGTYYVVDTGSKRVFPNTTILDHWTAHKTLSVPTVTDGFINILPTVGAVERVIKGSAPMVYSAESGTKRHILYSDTYNRYYAPFGMVGDRLLDTIPNGSPIP